MYRLFLQLYWTGYLMSKIYIHFLNFKTAKDRATFGVKNEHKGKIWYILKNPRIHAFWKYLLYNANTQKLGYWHMNNVLYRRLSKWQLVRGCVAPGLLTDHHSPGSSLPLQLLIPAFTPGGSAVGLLGRKGVDRQMKGLHLWDHMVPWWFRVGGTSV